LFEVAARYTTAEPHNSLLGAAVGKALGNHVALRALLHSIVANLRRRVEPFLDIALFQDVVFLVGVVCPNPRQEIGLQFQPNRCTVRSRLVQ